MAYPLVPALCTPSDFVNPYPALLVPVAICAGLLSFGAVALFVRSRRHRQSEQIGHIHALYRLLYKTIIGTAAWSWALAAWLLWQSQEFSNGCLYSHDSPRVLLFFAEQKGVTGTVIFTTFLLVSSLILVVVEQKSRNENLAM